MSPRSKRRDILLLSALSVFILGATIAQSQLFQAQTLSTSKEYIYFGGKLIAVEEPVPGGCAVSLATPPALPADTVWVDDQVPSGSTVQGTWTWDTYQKVSGSKSNTQSVIVGMHQQLFFGANSKLTVSAGDNLVTYVLINPCSPPQEIMLKWRDTSGSWEHRAYWGSNLINEGVNGTASRYSMGALPLTGAWIRLVVPASAVNMAGRKADGMAFTLYDGQAWFDRSGKGTAGCLSASVPSLPSSDTVWVEDQVPAGATVLGTWIWDTTQKASGTQSHTDPAAAGLHQHYFQFASQGLSVGASENLVTYVLINPCNPPQEIMLQFQDSSGSFEHRAFWGKDLISWGTSGTTSRYPMGSLPISGNWVRLEVPAVLVDMGARVAAGMAFTLYDGQAWFDRAGKGSGTCVTATPPASLPNDTVWVEDQAPAGAALIGTWVWDTNLKVSGTQSHTEPVVAGMHQHYFQFASQGLSVGASENLVTYVLINPCNPPQEIMLQFQDSSGSFEHRAFWGKDLMSWGTSGTSSRYPMGALPAFGSWVRLEVPAALVNMGGTTAIGMTFTLYDGQAWFDRAGKGAGTCVAPLPPSLPASDTVWVEDQIPTGATVLGTWVWDTTVKASGTQSHTEPAAAGMHQHYFQFASQTLSVSSSENLMAYVLINPCNPPQEIMLQFQDASGSFEHRAFWGANLINSWGTTGTASRYPMGALPVSGSWVRLEVPSSFVDMGGRTAVGMTFTLYGGQAWFDRAGKGAGTCVTASSPASLPNDTVWADDQAPAGATLGGTWVWDTTRKASGTQSHTEPAASGVHEHWFQNVSFPVNVGDKLVTYVLINPCNPPSEILLEWQDFTTGTWEHRAFWGSDLIQWGTLGTASRYQTGNLPQSNVWVRLEVSASAVGLEGKTVTGMGFALSGGQAWFDRAGKNP